jgi:hypothetical protein
MSFTDEELALMALDASLHQSEETRTILALVAEVQYLRRLLLVREQQVHLSWECCRIQEEIG